MENEDEIVTVTIGDIVVVQDRRDDTYTVRSGSLIITQGRVTDLLHRPLTDEQGNEIPAHTLSPEIAYQVAAFNVADQFFGALAQWPGLTPKEKASIEAAASEFKRIALALAAGDSIDNARASVELAVKAVLNEVGDKVGAMVTTCMIGAAGLTATAWTGPGAVVGGGLAIATGILVGEMISHDQNAKLITDLIFIGYEAIVQFEELRQESFTDFMNDLRTDIADAIFGDLPIHLRPHLNIQMTDGKYAVSATRYEGDFRFNLVSFSGAASAVTLDLSLTGAQNGGGAGIVQFFTVEGLQGSAFDDTLIGSFARNEFIGGAGNDYIDGGLGFDFADYRDAEGGVVIDLRITQQVSSDRGADTLINIEGVIGGSFDDVLTGSHFDNVLIGGTGDDVLHGEGGDDVLMPFSEGSPSLADVDIVDGGDGFDMVDFSEISMQVGMNPNNRPLVTVDLAAGTAAVGSARATLSSVEGVLGSTGHDTIRGSAVNNWLEGGAGHDTIDGRAGDDFIDGGSGNDTLTGGDGTDTLSLGSATQGVTATLQSSTINGDAVSGFENLSGSNFNDVLGGDSNINVLSGGTGDDYLDGAAGADTLQGGDGNDFLVGGAGDDALTGGEGSDYASYGEASEGVTARLDTGMAFSASLGNDTLASIENLYGSAFNDTLIGSSGANLLHGGAGYDVILGGGGDDAIAGGAGSANELYGGAGSDYYVVEANDTIVELVGEGVDSVEARVGSFTLSANVENLFYAGSTNFSGSGNALNNVIVGGGGDDVLSGRGGNDALYGGEGHDIVVFRGAEGDYLVETIDGGLRITDSVSGRDGVTFLADIEVAQFGDGSTVDLPSPGLAGRGSLIERPVYPTFGHGADFGDTPWWFGAAQGLEVEWSL